MATTLKGDLNLVNDSPSGASADVGPVLGLLTGSTIIGGGLDLPDPGSVSGSGGSNGGIDESNSATIFGVSNGAATPHTLRFQWTNFATTSATPGDEAAVRLRPAGCAARDRAAAVRERPVLGRDVQLGRPQQHGDAVQGQSGLTSLRAG